MSDLQLYWGDLHNHNGIGYGEGTIERTYALARNSLDFCAFIPHGWWTDPPGNDPRLKARHEEGFAHVREAWPEVCAFAERANEDGRFTAFLGFEWHSSRWGDYHLLFPGGQGEVYRADTLDELKAFALRHDALPIPHHCAYKPGWRGIDWQAHDDALSPVAEVYSEHGDCFSSPSHRPMMNHSMGGSCRSQTILEQLKRGKVVGFTAGTDNHYGYPASYGEGITGVWATGLSRKEIMTALRRRHTVACTGDRIRVQFAMGDATMGDVVPSDAPRAMRIAVEGADEIDYVELNRNGRPLQRWHDACPADAGEGRTTLRIEWGWDAMLTQRITDWTIDAALRNARIEQVLPCFGGGPASVERLNQLTVNDENSFSIQSYTSRQNILPTNSVVLKAADVGPGAVLDLKVSGTHCDAPFHVTRVIRLAEIAQSEDWSAISDVFSAPRLHIGPAVPTASLTFDVSFTDPEPGKSDFYFVKVLQKNGHMAWSSPIWCRGE